MEFAGKYMTSLTQAQRKMLKEAACYNLELGTKHDSKHCVYCQDCKLR